VTIIRWNTDTKGKVLQKRPSSLALFLLYLHFYTCWWSTYMAETCRKIKKTYKVSVFCLCGLYLLVIIQTVSTLNTTGCTLSYNIHAKGMTVPRNLHCSFGDFFFIYVGSWWTLFSLYWQLKFSRDRNTAPVRSMTEFGPHCIKSIGWRAPEALHVMAVWSNGNWANIERFRTVTALWCGNGSFLWIYALLGFYASSLRMPWPLKMGPTAWPETSVTLRI